MGNCDVNDVMNNVLNAFVYRLSVTKTGSFMICVSLFHLFFFSLFWVEKILFLELQGFDLLQLTTQLSERRVAPLLFVAFRRFHSETLQIYSLDQR